MHEKGTLTETEVWRFKDTESGNPYHRLVFLLGAGLGLRRGEMRGLLWGDIDGELLHIRHNFVNGDGLKAPKCGSYGDLALPSSVKAALNDVRNIARHTKDNGFVFESFRAKKQGLPMGARWFDVAFETVMDTIGIDAATRKERNLTLHGLRHTAATLQLLLGATPAEAAALLRHRSIQTTQRYIHTTQAANTAASARRFELVREAV
jgi:integrase